jgi:hypothetical protein
MMAEERLNIDREKNKMHLPNGVTIRNGNFAVGRELTTIFTKSTMPYDPTSNDYEQKWILSIKDNGKK